MLAVIENRIQESEYGLVSYRRDQVYKTGQVRNGALIVPLGLGIAAAASKSSSLCHLCPLMFQGNITEAIALTRQQLAMRRDPETLRALATMLLMRSEVEHEAPSEAFRLLSEVRDCEGTRESVGTRSHRRDHGLTQSASLAFDGWRAGRDVMRLECKPFTSKVKDELLVNFGFGPCRAQHNPLISRSMFQCELLQLHHVLLNSDELPPKALLTIIDDGERCTEFGALLLYLARSSHLAAPVFISSQRLWAQPYSRRRFCTRPHSSQPGISPGQV